MKSIFNIDNNAELINRFDQLTITTPALWGKMNTAQMMAHCTASMNTAFGYSKNHRHWVGIFFGNFTKRRMLRAEQLDRNIPAYIKLRITDKRDFAKEKTQLIALIKSIPAKGEAGLAKCPHPYFRHFKPCEWSQLNWKHLDHHLRQFGV
jgi:ribosomal protein L39E